MTDGHLLLHYGQVPPHTPSRQDFLRYIFLLLYNDCIMKNTGKKSYAKIHKCTGDNSGRPFPDDDDYAIRFEYFVNEIRITIYATAIQNPK